MIVRLVLPQDRKSQAVLCCRLVQTVCCRTLASVTRQLSCRSSQFSMGRRKNFKELLTEFHSKITSRFLLQLTLQLYENFERLLSNNSLTKSAILLVCSLSVFLYKSKPFG